MQKTPARPSQFWILVLLVLAIWAAYRPVLSNGFVNYDDTEYVTENTHVQDGLTPGSIKWAFTAAHSFNWHPLTWISHMLDCGMYGLDPGAHHRTNLLFHTASTLLLFFLLIGLTGKRMESAIVSALFALHPLHVESVAWVAERKDVLSTFFLLLVLWTYVSYTRKPSLPRYGLVAVLFILGLMSKPMLVSVPLILLIMDFWPLGRLDQGIKFKRLIYEKVPFFALSAASCVVTVWAQRTGGAIGSLERYPLGVRFANAPLACMEYLIKTVWPARLAVFYPHPGHSLPTWQVAGSVAFLILITLFVFRDLRRRPYLAAGWLWFLVTLVPVIGIVQVGDQAMADRYTYVPLVGIFFAAIWLVTDLFDGFILKRRKKGDIDRRPLLIALLPVLLVLAVLTHRQASYWQDSVTLYQHALACTKNNSLAHNNLGVALVDRMENDEAEKHFLEAVRISPSYVEARFNLAKCLQQSGKTHQAVEHLRVGLRMEPDHIEAANNLAWVLAVNPDPSLRNGREAVRWAEVACGKTGHNAPVFLDTLAAAYAEAGRFGEAVKTEEKAVKLAGDMGQEDFIRTANERLSLYLNDRPYHEQ